MGSVETSVFCSIVILFIFYTLHGDFFFWLNTTTWCSFVAFHHLLALPTSLYAAPLSLAKKPALRLTTPKNMKRNREEFLKDDGPPVVEKPRERRPRKPPTDTSAAHVCGTCGYATTRKSDLKKHQSSHLRIRFKVHEAESYTCFLCGQAFRKYESLVKHRESHLQQAIPVYPEPQQYSLPQGFESVPKPEDLAFSTYRRDQSVGSQPQFDPSTTAHFGPAVSLSQPSNPPIYHSVYTNPTNINIVPSVVISSSTPSNPINDPFLTVGLPPYNPLSVA